MMRVLEYIVAIIVVAVIIFGCLTVEPGESDSTDEVKYHKNCYYDDDGEEISDKAVQQIKDITTKVADEAKKAVTEIEQEITLKTKELEDLQKQFDVYKAKMESLLISQLELLKDIKED